MLWVRLLPVQGGKPELLFTTINGVFFVSAHRVACYFQPPAKSGVLRTSGILLVNRNAGYTTKRCNSVKKILFLIEICFC